MVNPFTPGDTVNIAATGASASVALPNASSQVMVTVPAGGELTFVRFGASTVTAAVASATPVNPGTSVVFTVAATATHAAAITGGGSSTVYFTAGDGF